MALFRLVLSAALLIRCLALDGPVSPGAALLIRCLALDGPVSPAVSPGWPCFACFALSAVRELLLISI